MLQAPKAEGTGTSISDKPVENSYYDICWEQPGTRKVPPLHNWLQAPAVRFSVPQRGAWQLYCPRRLKVQIYLNNPQQCKGNYFTTEKT